jgi:hypothetical protein
VKIRFSDSHQVGGPWLFREGCAWTVALAALALWSGACGGNAGIRADGGGGTGGAGGTLGGSAGSQGTGGIGTGGLGGDGRTGTGGSGTAGGAGSGALAGMGGANTGGGGSAGVGGLGGGSAGTRGIVGGSGGGGRVGMGGVSGTGGGAGGQIGCAPLFQSCAGGVTCCATSECDSTSQICGPPHVSDRNAKREFVSVNDDEILEALSTLPILTWSYKADESKSRHIGPMAQDFMAAFHVGSSDRAIFQIDADGVAFAAIQSLNEKMKRLMRENETLRREMSNMRSEMVRDHKGPHDVSHKVGNLSAR